MNKAYFFAILGLLSALFTGSSQALPKDGALMLQSPNKEYTLKLFDTKDPGEYELKIFRHHVELAHYPMEEELLSAYWSPTLKFVAVNNHNGHFGFYVWIISLADGSIITSHGIVKDPNYDKYSDENDLPDLFQVANAKLKKIYPGVDDDQLREGYSSVAYGWTAEGQLLMFHEFPFDNFYTKYNRIIQAFTTWNVTDQNVSLRSIWFRTARDDKYEPMPKEVKKTLNF